MDIRSGRLSGVGEFLDYTFQLFKQHIGRLIAISAVVNVPYVLLSLRFEATPAGIDPGVALTLSLVILVFSFFFVPWMVSALTLFCGNLVLHNKTLTLKEIYGNGLKYVGRVIGISFLTGLSVVGVWLIAFLVSFVVGPFAFVVGLFSIVLAIWFSLSTYAGLLEDCTVTQAMGRSRELVQTRFWTVVGFFILTGIIYAIGYYGLLFIVGAVIGLVGLEGLFIGELVISVISVVLTLIYSGFSALALAVLYSQLRIRKEGLDLQAEAEALVGGAGLD